MSFSELQSKVHVAKDKVNTFGKYNYRTAEGILAAVKAALPDGASVIVTDEIQEVAGQIFVSSTAKVSFADGTTHTAQGHAMHPLTKKGMDPSQITGTASSYARKYALGGLMALDDGSADPDAAEEEYKPETNTHGPTTKDKVDAAKTLDEVNSLISESAKHGDAAKRHLNGKAVSLGFVYSADAGKFIQANKEKQQ